MARQTDMGSEVTKQKKVTEIEDQGEVYRKAASSSQRARQKTADARDSLIALLQKHGLETYKDSDGFTYSVSVGKQRIVVTEPGGSDEDAGDEATVE